MAIQATKKSKFGFDVNYWKIAKITLDTHTKLCDVKVIGFTSEEDRNMGGHPVETKMFRCSALIDKDYEKYFGTNAKFTEGDNIQQRAYEFVKSRPFFDEYDDIL